MATGAAFLVRRSLQALVLLVLVVAGWAAPQPGFAAAEPVDAAPALEAASRQFRGPNPHALDWPHTDHCALPRKSPASRAEARRLCGAADANSDAPAEASAVLTAAGLGDRKSGAAWRPSLAGRALAAVSPAAFRSRAPPPRRRW